MQNSEKQCKDRTVRGKERNVTDTALLIMFDETSKALSDHLLCVLTGQHSIFYSQEPNIQLVMVIILACQMIADHSLV